MMKLLFSCLDPSLLWLFTLFCLYEKLGLLIFHSVILIFYWFQWRWLSFQRSILLKSFFYLSSLDIYGIGRVGLFKGFKIFSSLLAFESHFHNHSLDLEFGLAVSCFVTIAAGEATVLHCYYWFISSLRLIC